MKKSFLFLILFSTILFTGCSTTKMEDLPTTETETETQIQTSLVSTEVSNEDSIINTESLLDLEIVTEKVEEEKFFEDYNYTANASDDRFNFETPFEVGNLYVKIIGTTNQFIDYMVISKEGELFYYQDTWDDFALFLVSNEIPMFDNPLEIDEVIFWDNKELPEGYIDGDYDNNSIVEESTTQEESVSQEETTTIEETTIEESTSIEEETTQEESVVESTVTQEIVQPKKYNDIISRNTYFSEEFFSDGSKIIIHSNIDCKMFDDSMISIIEVEKYDDEFYNLSNSVTKFDHCDKCVK